MTDSGPASGGSIVRDPKTVAGFGYEWTKFDQTGADPAELERVFHAYFDIFPWSRLPRGAIGFDLGCGSGRWARFVAARVKDVVCVEPSKEALRVAVRNLKDLENCHFVCSGGGEIPLGPKTMDFGYSLGVLHHTPDPPRALADAVGALKPGAPFLVYLYYAFDNRPGWFRIIWRGSDAARRAIARLPPRARYATSQVLALAVYLPLARLARLMEARGSSVDRLPLSSYRDKSFYTMRTDVLDRFGTRLERRYTAEEVEQLMEDAGLRDVMVSRDWPYWCAVGYAGG